MPTGKRPLQLWDVFRLVLGLGHRLGALVVVLPVIVGHGDSRNSSNEACQGKELDHYGG